MLKSLIKKQLQHCKNNKPHKHLESQGDLKMQSQYNSRLSFLFYILSQYVCFTSKLIKYYGFFLFVFIFM